MPKIKIDTSMDISQVVKNGNELHRTMDRVGKAIEKNLNGSKVSGLGNALKPLAQELAEIMTQADDTAAQIKVLEKSITNTENTRGKLAERLSKAKSEAEQTAAALDEVNTRLDAARNSKYGIPDNDPDLGLNKKLSAQLEQEDAKVEQITAEYQGQQQTLDALNQRHAELTEKLKQEQAAAERQAAALQRQTEAAGRAAEFKTADDAMQSYFDKQVAGIEKQYAKIEAAQSNLTDTEETAAQHAQRIVEETQREVTAQDQAAAAALRHAAAEQQAVPAGQQLAATQQKITATSPAASVERTSKALKRAGTHCRSFSSRLKSIVLGALIFNVISAALRSLTSWLGTAITQTSGFSTALSRLKGAAMTCAAPLVEVLGTALTKIMNIVTTLLGYLAQLISLITGKSVSAMQAQAKALNDTGKAASSASKSLAKFDEINRLDKQDSGSSDTAADFSSALGNLELSGWAKNLWDEFKAGFKEGFGDAAEGIENIKADLKSIGATLKDIWTDPDVQAAVQRYVTAAVHELGQITGAAASIGVSIAENLIGGLARYLESSKEFIKTALANAFNIGADINELLGDFAQAIATVFRSLGSEGAKQLTAGLMGTLGNTLLGVVQTLGETLYGVLYVLLTPIIDNADKLRQAFSLAFEVIAPFFTGMAQGIAEFYTALGNLYNNVILPLVQTLGGTLSSVLSGILDFINWALENLTGLSDVLSGVGEVVGWLVGGITAVLSVLAVFKTTAAALGAIVAGVSAVFSGIGTAVSAAGAAIAALASPIGIAVVAIGAIIAAGVLLYQNWDTIKTKAIELGQNLQQSWEDMWANIWATVDQWGQDWGQFCTDTRASLEQYAADMGQKWDTMWSDLYTKGSTWSQSLQQSWNDMWQSLWTMLNTKVGELQTSFSTFTANIQTGWSTFCSNITTGMQNVQQIFTSIWSAIGSFIGSIVSGIIQTVTNMVSAITNAINSIRSALSGIGSKVSSAFSSAQSALSAASVSDYAVSGVSAASVSVPALAQGAVLPANREFLAVVGDQSRGTNVEAPLETITQAVLQALSSLSGQGQSDSQPINIYLGDELLDSVIAKSERRRALRSGGMA